MSSKLYKPSSMESHNCKRSTPRLFCCLLIALLAFPCASVRAQPIEGTADVLSGLYIDEQAAGCDNQHIRKDFIYLTPNTTDATATAWSEVASGEGLADRFKVLTGDTIRVRYKAPAPSPAGRRLLSDAPAPELDGIEVLSESQAHEVYSGTPIRVKSIIYIIRTCGWNASATPEEIQSLFFTANYSISGYHNTCSYGKINYDPAENYVFGYVDVPCNGTVTNGVLSYPYNAATSCGAAEQFAWRQAGETAAKAANYSDFIATTQRRRIVHILPREVKCGWAGLGSVGCGGSYCVTYIHGNYAKSLTVNMHELSHTQGLSHAGKGMDEYGDTTDVMGTTTGQGYACFNVGNQFRIGLNKPVATLLPNETNSLGNANAPGLWTLPATTLTDTNALYLLYNVDGADYPNIFISFRTRSPRYDNILPSTVSNKVSVHIFNGTASDRDYNRTLLVATLAKGGVYTSPFQDRNNDQNIGGAVRITVTSINAGLSATVQLCRFTQLVESGAGCSDGIDNDCDGLVDDADPNCQSPPPPSSPQPAP